MMIHPKTTRTILVGQTMAKTPPADARPGILFSAREGAAFRLPFDTMGKGILVLGGTGSGKTTSIFLPMLDQILEKMTAEDVLLVFDPKGDFHTLVRQKSKGSRVVVVSSDPADGADTANWNIYEEILSSARTREEAELLCGEHARTIFAREIDSQQPFFGEAAADVLAFVLVTFIREAWKTNNYARLNNAALVGFLRSANLNTLHDLIDLHPDYQYLTTIIGERGKGMSPQALGVLGVLNSTVSATFIGPFRKAGNVFSMARIAKERGRSPKGTVVLLKYTVRHKAALERIYSLLVESFIKEVLSLEHPGGSTYMLLDELPMLPHVESLQDALNFGRSKGLKTVCGLQSVTQLEHRFGTAAGPLLAGFTSCIALRCVDLESRLYVSERFGKTFEEIGFAGRTLSHESHLICDADQRNLGTGAAYIDLPDHAPFRFEFRKF